MGVRMTITKKKGTATILARSLRSASPIETDRRYHARVMHRDGRVEEIVRTVRRDRTGKLYINLAKGAPLPLFGAEAVVRLIGQVIGTYVGDDEG